MSEGVKSHFVFVKDPFKAINIYIYIHSRACCRKGLIAQILEMADNSKYYLFGKFLYMLSIVMEEQ
jgi:hypothetical protein